MLRIEALETRELPAASVSLVGGTLAVLGDAQDNIVNVMVSATDATQIVVVADGVTQTFAAASVQRIFLDGQDGDDILTSQVSAVPDFLRGGNGHDTLQAFGASSVVLGEAGADTIYAIVGQGAVLDGGNGRDRIIGNATSIILNDAADRPNVVFGVATQPVQLIAGVVYFLGTPNADSAQISEQFGRLLVSYNGQIYSFAKKDVDTFASVLGGGNDFVLNASSVDGVFYGAAGSDTLLGGSGNDLLKGGGSDDVIAGGAGDDDLTGDPGRDTVIGGPGRNILRVDAADVVFGSAVDIVVGMRR